jgi:hypothetical protein
VQNIDNYMFVNYDPVSKKFTTDYWGVKNEEAKPH